MGFNIPVAASWFLSHEYSNQKAYILAEIAEAAYLEPHKFAGLVQFWGITQWQLFSNKSAQAYAFNYDGNAFIAFRGTKIYKIDDILVNTAIMQVTSNLYQGKVHTGFYNEVSKLWPEIKKWVSNNNFKHLFLTGHSLGGAMAVIASTWIGIKNMSCYTYGTPRIGDVTFQTYYNNMYNCYRFINHNDLVCRLPFRVLGYRHVGKAKYINHDGDIDKYSIWIKLANCVKGTLSASVNGFNAFDSIDDHRIKNYKANLQKYILHDPKLLEHYFKLLDK